MPFIGSFSGSKLVRGSGAYHPNVVTIDLSGTQAQNSVIATSTASTTASGSTNRLSGLTVSSISTTPRVAYDPFQNGTVNYFVSNPVATGTFNRVSGNNIYINTFTLGGYANFYAGQPIYIGGPGATHGYLLPTTYYIVSINSGSGYITVATSYANYQSSTVAGFATSSAGDGSGYTWTDTYPTFSAGGGLPPGISNANGYISGPYTMNNSNGNGQNFDVNSGGVTALSGEPVKQLNNVYAFQLSVQNSRAQVGTTEIFNIQLSIPYEFRQILTTAYILGGYKSSTPWSNVNKATGATDTNINAGNLSHAQGYTTGPCGWNYAYVMGAGDTVSSASNIVCAWNMRTDTNRTTNYTSTWVDSVNGMAKLQQENYYAWMTAGSTIREFSLATETYNGTPSNQTGAGCSEAAGSHEVRGIWSNQSVSWAFATRTGTSRAAGTMSSDNMRRIMENKNASPGQYGGSGHFVTSFPNDTTTNTGVGEPYSCGESNDTTVQDWGYCIGYYDGAHQPNSYKLVYTTVAITTNPNGMQYQGQAGDSSGWGAWRD